MYGTQTSTSRGTPHFWFENDVKMYGTQTRPFVFSPPTRFENDVKMYGTQTSGVPLVLASRLRMM